MSPVRSHVTIQIATLRESGLAYLTLVWFLSCMCPIMLRQCWTIGKSFSTDIALVGSVSWMGPHVCSDWTALWKPSITNWAFERLVPSVCPQVSSEVCSLGEGLLTDWALIWFLSWMRSKMSLQRRLASISLPTNMTWIVARECFFSARWEVAW